MIVCLLPCLLAGGLRGAGVVSGQPRTRLFVLPCFTLLAMMTAEDLLAGYRNGPSR